MTVGAYLSESLPQPLVYVSPLVLSPAGIPPEIIIPVMAGSIVVVVILSLFIICCLVLYQRKRLHKVEMELMDMTFAKDSIQKPVG